MVQTEPTLQIGGRIVEALAGVAWGRILLGAVAFVLGFLVVYVVGRAVFVPLVRRTASSRGFDPAVVGLAETVAGALVLFAAVAVAFTVAGYGAFLSAFAVFGGAVALALGIAAQDLLGNFVAGVFILKDKPFREGDWIEWEETSGRVENIDLRVTRVRTFDNELVTVPNSELANNPVKNPVAYDTLRQKFVFGIGYDDDIDRATNIVVEEANRHPEILAAPEPSVRLTGLGDDAVDLESRFWIGEPSRSDFVRIRSEYVQAVKERFDAAGIDMPYVHRQLTGEVEVLERVGED